MKRWPPIFIKYDRHETFYAGEIEFLLNFHRSDLFYKYEYKGCHKLCLIQSTCICFPSVINIKKWSSILWIILDSLLVFCVSPPSHQVKKPDVWKFHFPYFSFPLTSTYEIECRSYKFFYNKWSIWLCV